MDQAMSGFMRPADQSHVPQQSRRDKLRVQQQAQANFHHHNFPNNFDQFITLHPSDHSIAHLRNARHATNFLYDPTTSMIPSEMLDFSARNATNNNNNDNVPVRNSVLEWRSNHNHHHHHQQLNPLQYQSFDWPATNFSSASASTSTESNQNNLINSSSTNDYQIINSGQVVGQKYLAHSMNFASPCDNVVTVASTGPMEISDTDRDQNELALLPLSYVNRSSTTLRFDNVVSDSNLQGLSLSLSSINPQFQSSELDHLRINSANNNDNKPAVMPKPSIISKANHCGRSLQDIVGASSGGYRSTAGPLGPFTGYATILKSSRFLKPAQQLLDEFCGSKGTMVIKGTSNACDDIVDNISERFSGEVCGWANYGDHDRGDVDATEGDGLFVAKKASSNNNNNNNNSCGSSSTFYGSNDGISGEGHGGVGGSLCFGSSRPEQEQQKKAKLLFMQEEVSRKYKQYRQQMQMAVSSFESVAGLGSATPYIFMALKAVSRHFRCLKSVITDQLNHTRKVLGEDLPISPTSGSSSKLGDHHHNAFSTARLKYMEPQSFQKYKPGGANMAFPEPQQQHIWRPQRGLPERSVAILRAWLFEHFLHPYPTDTDKHMLATQTGLTRNQVSNWFINARVRVWKPMVEEIHSLETNALADQVDKGPGKLESNPASLGDQASTKLGTSVVPSKPSECPNTSYSAGPRDHRLGTDQQQQQQQQLSQEKRLRSECQVPTSMTGTLMGFVPYHRSGLEVWSHAHQWHY